ncbi:xanthan lyase [Parabacteroides distasonis]|uniref:golvesin C-terminal-like domain-containing protein n=1 Tax=Parabacteroides distasonis TaxID=823 RepID=UPI001897B314|nr:xanthan lyase [Parabacteroides distasonis]MDB8998638.1 xanthan lyase [Parabacteroides distasonis]MDB9073553.1 xanthan lyase [Parabacteroides distasonis]
MREKLSYPVRIIISLLSIFLWSFPAEGQDSESLKKQLDQKLNSFARQYVSSRTIKIDSILIQKKKVTLFTNEALEDIPFREYNVSELYASIAPLFPNASKIVILTRGTDIESLIPEYDRKGRPNKKRLYSIKESKYPLTRSLSSPHEIKNGLQNRHIALWQSHGLYYAQTAHRWEWQRARMFGTVEDLFTQSFVLPYLTPMLENAGATILIPRERDTQIHEIIIDNDRSTPGSEYKELDGEKAWSDGEKAGFGHIQATYTNGENPFTQGTYRQTVTQRKGKESLIEWIPEIPESGNYAVYASYQSFPNSTEQALYTIHHAGGETTIAVNQTMGGGTWIYLGNFKFTAHEQAHERIVLTNQSNKSGKIITADAIKIGGGMGNIARSPLESPYPIEAETSGYPRFTEAARYWLQWAGMPDSIYSKSAFHNDYQDDIYARPRWVNYLKEQAHIPIDMAFAFHSDAGTTPDDSIIGTLGIYMSKSNDGIYTNRKSREIARDLTDMIQTQILSDVRKVYNPQWSRRGMWNQSYIEARIPDVPTMLLELLSHQNFADMRYGLDPRFRFLICRAIYKGMLRYICFQNKQEPIVQPLPPDRLYTELVETNKVRIGWKAVQDTLEESASPTAYILYSRKDSGGFDNGTLVKGEEIILPIETGIIHSYKVAAVNKGGISFPSEIVSVYRSPKGEKDKTVLIVNGFDRISGPASFESAADSLAGFLYAVDRGVPYLNDIAFIGDQFEFRRSATWNSNDNNGHGDSYNNYAGQVIAGNTFDYPFIHGQAMAETGYSFVSCSHKSLAEGVVKPDTYPIIDLILGKQRQPVITPVLQDTLRGYLAQGGNLLVSGTNLFSDSWGNAQDRTFVEEVLKGKLASRNASKEGIVNSCASPYGYINGRYTFRTRPNPICYSIESVDGVLPADKLAHTILRYPENNIGAGIVYEGKYRTCSLGFPFEALQTPSERNRLMESILRFFSIQQQNKIQYIQ